MKNPWQKICTPCIREIQGFSSDLKAARGEPMQPEVDGSKMCYPVVV